ncbi:hypothetical protein ACLTEW_14850 [Gordonia lacunae]|uniref:ESX-1 secretion-associated protein n=1 Tax=Gordonia lacunae TaxID=417102 RepID=A0A243Q8M5_9ACTN|nr:hypothetical protein [Gordonia lacunae]OUC78101.1 hypothetical protein CA982_14140 [Gordonia lacunae]
MTLPGPLSGFPPLTPGRRDQNDSESSLFGVDPAEIQEIARAWRASGIAIHAADVEAMGAVIGPSSRVVRALSATVRPARLAIDSIGERLTAMSGMLRTFDATTAATDARSGALFHALEDR